MAESNKFTLIFAPEVVAHLRSIDRKHHGLIRETINQQLLYQPLEVTRNRKPLEPPAPFDATWELRFGPENRFRVLYEVDSEASQVLILAIGIKVRDQLMIGGEEIDL